MRSPVIRSTLFFVALFTAGRPALAQPRMWDSPTGGEIVDQEQLIGGAGAEMRYGKFVGQVFTPQTDHLERLDLAFYNGNDYRPITVRVREWACSCADPPQGAILFEDTITLAERGTMLRSIFPRVPVNAGQQYLIELRSEVSPGEVPSWRALYASGGGANPPDLYTGGALCLGGTLRVAPFASDTSDLFFRTYDEATQPAWPGGFDASDPSLPWTAPATPMGPLVTPGDYRALVEIEASGHDAACVNPANPAQVSQYCETYAAYEAFVYQAALQSGSPNAEIHADRAIKMLENARAWYFAAKALAQQQNTQLPVINVETTGVAYHYLLGSPTLTAQNHVHIQEMMADMAPRLWQSRSSGLNNVSLQRALELKLVSTLCTNTSVLPAQDAADYAAFADSIWNDLQAWWETDEDTTAYNMNSLRSILMLVLLHGDTAWSQPGLRALIDRVAAQHTPLGPGPAAGSSDGWSSHWAVTTWAFEKAAARYNDPSYRWLAYRSFDYARQHVKGQPMHATQADGLHTLSFAYFEANPALPIAPPPPQFLARGARQDTDASTAALVTPATPIGQTFTAEADRLAWLSVEVDNPHTAPVSGRISLWPWLGSEAATLASAPLFQEDFQVPAQAAGEDLVFRPHVPLDPQGTFFIQLTTTDPHGYLLAISAGDTYAGGALWAGQPEGHDVFFTTASLAGDGSTMTTRLRPTPLPQDLFAATDPEKRYFDLTSEVIPDKLILRSGPDPDAFTVVVNLVHTPTGHGQPEPGAILTVVDDGSLLFQDQGYEAYALQDHSVTIAKRHRGGAFLGLTNQMSVDRLEDYRKATVASLSWSDVHGWSLEQGRAFFFVKDRFLVVRDRASVGAPMQLSFGSVWHANDIAPTFAASDSWYDVYYREPLAFNRIPFTNPPRSMLLYMVPRPGFETWEVALPYSNVRPATPRYVMYQKHASPDGFTGVLRADTVLLPHGPSLSPADAAADITVLHRDDATGALALRIEVGDEIWTVVDNPVGAPMNVGGALLTDAVYLVARTRPGAAPYVLTEQASQVQIDNGAGLTIQRSWPIKTSVEEGG